MRNVLAETGVGNTITVFGQYQRVGGDFFLVTDLKERHTDQWICQHIWIPKYGISDDSVFWWKEHNDFIVFTGEVYEYERGWRYGYQHDYGIRKIHDIRLIRPMVYQNRIVFIPCTKPVRYSCCRYIKGYWDQESLYNFATDQVRHLWVNYEIENETDTYYDLIDKAEDQRLRVYKEFDVCLEQLM